MLNDTAATPTPESPPHKHQQLDMSATATHLPHMNLEPPPPALQIKLLSETARAPTRGSEFAAGYDLYASKSTTVPARGKVLADTDISIAVPADTCTLRLPASYSYSSS
jgi:dUTP pyrophosphatase